MAQKLITVVCRRCGRKHEIAYDSMGYNTTRRSLEEWAIRVKQSKPTCRQCDARMEAEAGRRMAEDND
jgi:ribosomal protein L40E